MKAQFENKTLIKVEIGNYTIKLLPSGCFSVRETSTMFQVFESSSTATYKEIRDYVMKLMD